MKKFKQIYLEITNKCNLNCPFCPNHLVRKRELSLKEIEIILSKVCHYTQVICLHIQGEPLIHPMIEQIIELIEHYQLKINLTTNGILLDKLRYLVTTYSCFEKINVSLQALINLNVEEQNKYLDKLVSFLDDKEQKMPDLPINLRLWNDKTNVQNQKIEVLVKEKLTKYIINHHVNHICLLEDEEFVWPTLDLPNNPVSSSCLGGKQQIGILSNGTIVLCCLDYLGHTNIGNIFEDDLSKILISKEYQDIVKGFNDRKPTLELCQKCTYRNRFIK